MRIDDLLVLITERRSVRKFLQTPVTDAEVRALLDAARCAPSNSNRQGWKFLFIKNTAVKKNMAEAVVNKVNEIRTALHDPDLIAAFNGYSEFLTFFTEAPLVVVALSKRSPSFLERIARDTEMNFAERRSQPEMMSIAMAIQNMQLAAYALGLGSCCMTGPLLAAGDIESLLDVRPPFELAAVIPVGHYDTLPPAPPRKDISLISEIIE
jgi:nitroreductase